MKVEEYSFVEPRNGEELDTQPIMISSGDYAGVVFAFGVVRVFEKIGKVKFSYTIHHISSDSSFTKEELMASDKFRDTIGHILVDVVTKHGKQEN